MTRASDQKEGVVLPGELPIFPLDGVLLLPRGQLPLNIFEPRYVAMVEDALSSGRMIGMIQTREDGSLYEVGCAGKITSFHETCDGRFEIVLTGISRFAVSRELSQLNGYRKVQADWMAYQNDVEMLSCLDIDRPKLVRLLKKYFDHQGLTCNWDAVENAADEKLINCLAMICPFEPKEKQALLEAPCPKNRARLFMTLLEMESCGPCSCQH